MRKILIISVLVFATPGTARAASPTPTPTVSPTASPVPAPLTGELRINEFLPNPVGTDTGNEWIELANVSEHDVAAGGLVVARVSGSTLATVPSGTTIKAGAVLLLNSLSGSIVNGGDTLLLKSGTTELDRVTYDANGAEGFSWSRISASEGAWTSIPTPGLVNPTNTGEEDEDDTESGGGSTGSATSAATKASAATAKASTKTAGASKATAKKLATSGMFGAPYLLLFGLGMLYWYIRRSTS
jgi:hypothetical protein